MFVDHTLQLRIFLQKREVSGPLEFFEICFENFVAFKNTDESRYASSFESRYADPDARYNTSRHINSKWHQDLLYIFDSPDDFTHFVLASETSIIEVISEREPLIKRLSESEVAELGLQKQTAVKVLLHPYDRDEIDRSLRNSKKGKDQEVERDEQT
ncbi:MAG: hypothetical protein KC777_09100 [Cyanobacteria bacterium HKST-UBA02]|nr:hypothetical protein [Cyanobacteria bacterium HKST-UBA02]